MLLEGFDTQWVDASFAVGPVALEIESHFERLLGRGALKVVVHDADARPTVAAAAAAAPMAAAAAEVGAGEVAAAAQQCEAIDYASLVESPNSAVRRSLDIGGGQTAEVNLCVLPSNSSAAARAAAQRPARFFQNGRRIGTASSVPSFAKCTENRWTVWAHPQV